MSEHDTLQLLCVVGTSPAVVSETIFGLCVERGEAIDRVAIVTTTVGKRELAAELRTILAVMAADYHLVNIPDPEGLEILWKIPEQDGAPLEDIRDATQSAAMANLITRTVEELTREGQPRLHASLAGGRKTMGYYLGSAMSLLARPTDELSHVLVSERAEQCKTFWYPPPTPRQMTTYEGEVFDASQERVELHTLPLIRLQHRLDMRGGALPDFAELVGMAQHAMREPRVELDCETGRLSVDGRNLQLKPVQHSILAVLLVARAHRQTPVARDDTLFADAPLGALRVWFYELRNMQGHDALFLDDQPDPEKPSATIEAHWDEMRRRLNKDRSRLKKQLAAQLPEYLVELLEVKQTRDEDGERWLEVAFPAHTIHLIAPGALEGRCPWSRDEPG